MIDSLQGRLLAHDEDFAILDVSGIRFHLEIPASTATLLPAHGEAVVLFTRMQLSVNDGRFLLFGFGSETERECFDILTTIPGIGPRKGLMMLSQIEIASFARAIIEQDLNFLSKIKGIGKKTAERLVVELREKMVPYVRSSTAEAAKLPLKGSVQEAIQALIVLGCRPAVAEKAIGEAIKELGEDAPTESLVRAGLRHR